MQLTNLYLNSKKERWERVGNHERVEEVYIKLCVRVIWFHRTAGFTSGWV